MTEFTTREFSESAGAPTFKIPSCISRLSFVPETTKITFFFACISSKAAASNDTKFFETSSSVPNDRFQT